MSLEIKQMIEVCEAQFTCKVQDKGFGIHSGGYRTLHIIVGKKINPGYDPENAWPNIRKAPKMIPDVRVIHIQPWITEDELIERLQVIKKSLPENRELPERDEHIVGIEPKNKQFREAPPVKEPKVEKPKKKVDDDSGLGDHPADELADQEEGKDDMIMDALSNIASTLSDVNSRLNKLEKKNTKTSAKK